MLFIKPNIYLIFRSTMIIKEVNGFEIVNDEKLHLHQFSGYFTRDSDVLIKYLDNQNHITVLMSNKDANRNLSTYKESTLLDNYRKKIEEPINHIKQIGKELIEDYNYKYFPFRRESIIIENTNINYDFYFNTPKMSLIRLEQLFILNDLPTWYIFEFIKPYFKTNLNLNCDINILNMIKSITKLDVIKIRKLKEYLDEYFQYLFDRPKNIYKINKLILPIDCINKIKIEQFAGYLVRSSNVIIEYIDNNNVVSMNNKEANESFMSWVKATFGNDSLATKKISDYRIKIENPNDSISQFEKKLKLNFEQRQCLIDLEQIVIRHLIPTSIIFEYTKKNAIIVNNSIYDWIKKITNFKKIKIINLKNYLDSYLEYTIQRNSSDNNFYSDTSNTVLAL